MNTGIIRLCLLITVIILSMNNMKAQTNTVTTKELSLQEKSVVIISALTATGDLESLKKQLNAGLDAGLTINEIKEIQVQLYAYCGFPRSLNGLNTFKQVLEERMAKGITDTVGKAVSVAPRTTDKYEQGRKVLEILTKTPQAKPAPGFGEFAPRIDAFLKEHLFADVFDSEVLTYQQRELVTISALAAMAGVESQLKSHVGMGKNTGITEVELVQVADLIEKYISRTQANTLRTIISKPTSSIIESDMMVRISEIEILPQYLDDYTTILKTEAAASIEKEPGVIAIFPMSKKDTPTVIRIVEIYKDKNAYQSHLQTPHFQHYKTTTLKMVKSLTLIDMTSIDLITMKELFRKIK
jgi:alkylhydroperoxidase/carboxymuconolactone decarboxylase family protein YurZ/quinol monooxygenase YgiN